MWNAPQPTAPMLGCSAWLCVWVVFQAVQASPLTSAYDPNLLAPWLLQYVFTATSPSGAPTVTSTVTNPLSGRFTGLRPATQ